MKDLLTKINNIATQKFGAQYAEARAQKMVKTMLTLKEERVEAAKQGIESGVALRVLVNGAWGFASVGSLDASNFGERSFRCLQDGEDGEFTVENAD